MNWIASKAFM